MIPTVAFDEAGNTGQNLLDPDQPIFTSCGVLLPDDAIGELRDLLEWKETEELHFVRLKRSKNGRTRILRLLDSPLVNNETAKTFAIHKPYMVTTKVIDMLMETLAHRSGIDMYKDGGAHATANFFYTVGSVFCGEDLYAEMLRRFVDMVRTGRLRAVRSYYRMLREMYEECTDDTFRAAIATLIATEAELIYEVLSHATLTDLDPAIPAFIQVAIAWDAQIQGEWCVIHDDSKPIAYEQDHIECYFQNEDEPRRGVGQGDHYAELPLRATSLNFRASDDVPQLQVADIVSGSTAHFFKGLADPSKKDELWYELADSPLTDLCLGAVWPSSEVDPDELGRRGDDGSAVQLAAELVSKGLRRRRDFDA
jgi:Protein of unknown function (DUF3800)